MSNEAGGVLAANGYARTSGRLGVATVTHGPALTNTVTALVESVRDHTPLLLLAGDTAVVDRENLQNISQRDVVMPTGAGFEQVRAPETVAEDLARAIRRAVLERRPVVLNVPVEFQWQQVEYSPTPPTLVGQPGGDARPSRDGQGSGRRRLRKASDRAGRPGSRRPLMPARHCCAWRAGSGLRWPRRCALETCSEESRTTSGSSAGSPHEVALDTIM